MKVKKTLGEKVKGVIFRKHRKMYRDMDEVISMCKGLEQEHTKNGIGVFFPLPEDKPIYEELVKRGVLVHNLLEPEGYSFTEAYKVLYTVERAGKVVTIDKDSIAGSREITESREKA